MFIYIYTYICIDICPLSPPEYVRCEAGGVVASVCCASFYSCDIASLPPILSLISTTHPHPTPCIPVSLCFFVLGAGQDPVPGPR
jgi:hypothetical protein